ncbi:MAG: TPM domain-containing protein [Bacteroidota bacterium]
MSNEVPFLTKEEEQEIVNAIHIAEKNTSGEIRVHIEKSTSIDTYNRAVEVFHYLKMDATELKNGVLIYLAIDNKSFIICGDKGINEAVPADFWDCTRDAMSTQFKEGNYKQGLINGILRAGEQLQKFFPWMEGDTNELSNEISKG